MDKFGIFRRNLEINGMDKLMKWLYSECLELASALVAVDLEPTKKHFEEVHEEIADCKVLLEQYFIFHNIKMTCKSVKLDMPIDDNSQMANLLASNGYYLKHGLNYPSAQIILKALNALETQKYASPEIEDIYNKKIKRLDKRLRAGELSE